MYMDCLRRQSIHVDSPSQPDSGQGSPKKCRIRFVLHQKMRRLKAQLMRDGHVFGKKIKPLSTQLFYLTQPHVGVTDENVAVGCCLETIHGSHVA